MMNTQRIVDNILGKKRIRRKVKQDINILKMDKEQFDRDIKNIRKRDEFNKKIQKNNILSEEQLKEKMKVDWNKYGYLVNIPKGCTLHLEFDSRNNSLLFLSLDANDEVKVGYAINIYQDDYADIEYVAGMVFEFGYGAIEDIFSENLGVVIKSMNNTIKRFMNKDQNLFNKATMMGEKAEIKWHDNFRKWIDEAKKINK